MSISYSLVCLGWVLWHINHCRLFNAKSSSYIYIKYIWFGWVGFYGISTIVGYLMLSLSSSSWCRAASTDLPDLLLPPVSIVLRSREIVKSTFWIGTELLYIGSSRSSCLCSSMWKGATGVCCLWVRPYFSSSVLHVWFV